MYLSGALRTRVGYRLDNSVSGVASTVSETSVALSLVIELGMLP